MTFKEYEINYANKDHILIRITDSFPYFKDKVIRSINYWEVEHNHSFFEPDKSCNNIH